MSKLLLSLLIYRGKGDITKLLECIPLTENADIERLITKYESLIESKAIKRFASFDRTKLKIHKLKDESKEAEQIDLAELSRQILSKNRDRQTYLNILEIKH